MINALAAPSKETSQPSWLINKIFESTFVEANAITAGTAAIAIFFENFIKISFPLVNIKINTNLNSLF
jgi:hypothetical protein